MNMKKILLIATLFSIFGISQTKAQKVVEYRESQARLAEPTMGVYIKPLIAELEINATVGKIKEKYFTMAIDEYAKRLSRYVKLDIVEVADEKTPDGASETEERMIRDKEGKRILSNLKEDSYVITLEIEGKMLDSVELSKKINQIGVSGKGHITFIIGGSLGLSDEVKARADYKLSFSKMTFPHQLMRVVLLEQIYRSYRILGNEPYHK